jgi:hypothetical protein
MNSAHQTKGNFDMVSQIQQFSFVAEVPCDSITERRITKSNRHPLHRGMKKSIILISVLSVAAMVLASCASEPDEGTTTNAPTQAAPAHEHEPFGSSRF